MTDERVFTKCAWHLIPFMALLYVVNFVDRLNVGFAALTMNKDLAFTPEIFGFGAGIFFIGYILFQVRRSSSSLPAIRIVVELASPPPHLHICPK